MRYFMELKLVGLAVETETGLREPVPELCDLLIELGHPADLQVGCTG